MPNPKNLTHRLYRRFGLSTSRPSILISLKEACGICIIALGLLHLIVVEILLEVGSGMLPSEFGLKVKFEPAGDNGEEAPRSGGGGNGGEGGEHAGGNGDINKNANISEEHASEEVHQLSPPFRFPGLSDNLNSNSRRTHVVPGRDQIKKVHSRLVTRPLTP